MSLLSKVFTVVKVVHNPIGAALGLVLKALMHTLLDEKRIALLIMSGLERLAASTKNTTFDDDIVVDARRRIESGM